MTKLTKLIKLAMVATGIAAGAADVQAAKQMAKASRFLWSTESLFNTLRDDLSGSARHIRDAGDTDQQVGLDD